MNEGGGGDETVLDQHRPPARAQARKQLRPSQAGFGLPWQTAKAAHARIEPVLEPGAFLPPTQKENSEPQFAENDGVDRDLALVLSQPFDRLGVGRRPRRLAENVDVAEVSHSVSVDSDSIGTKNPLLGAAEEPVERAFIGRGRPPLESVLAAAKTFDLERLPGFDPVLPPELGGQDDLAFRGNRRLHIRANIVLQDPVEQTPVALDRRYPARALSAVAISSRTFEGLQIPAPMAPIVAATLRLTN